jgi:hypothetical protein
LWAWILENSKWVDGCLEFSGCLTSDGYAAVTWGGKRLKGHRISYELNVGEIKDGLHVLHRCDNRKCINHDHLFLGTNIDNTEDRDRKGRAAKGESAGRSILTDADVLEIMASSETYDALSKKYGVGPTAVRAAKIGLTWRHL